MTAARSIPRNRAGRCIKRVCRNDYLAPLDADAPEDDLQGARAAVDRDRVACAAAIGEFGFELGPKFSQG